MRSLFDDSHQVQKGRAYRVARAWRNKRESISELMTAHKSVMDPSSHQLAGIAEMFGEHRAGAAQIDLKRWPVEERLHRMRASRSSQAA